MNKQLLFDAAAREGVLRGATLLANAVRVTLGPRSKCVLIDKRWGEPIVCNDGVTIAKELEVEDPTVNLGIRMLPFTAWLPARRHPHFMRCPACGSMTWCRIGWTE